MRLRLALALAAATSGCYLVPPVRTGAAGGGTAGDLVTHSAGGAPRSHDGAALTELHVGVTPLALNPGASRRTRDLSVGWLFDWTHAADGTDQLDHGLYLEGVWFLRGATPSPGARWRLGPTLRGELLVPRDEQRSTKRTDDRPGLGAAAGLLLELVEEFHGGGLMPGAYGGFRGELGIGVAVRAGVRSLEDGNVGFAMLSIELRWPGIMGIAIPLEPSRR